eukprot:gb/GECG01016177.1/.p1 GENE.gb/GECG01016177.1/~~gb/GECG01016177.1/.p1  ORF type:complete len:377 (+),score=32.38 gb/GECG01016177.1/:1-1131(+)
MAAANEHLLWKTLTELPEPDGDATLDDYDDLRNRRTDQYNECRGVLKSNYSGRTYYLYRIQNALRGAVYKGIAINPETGQRQAFGVKRLDGQCVARNLFFDMDGNLYRPNDSGDNLIMEIHAMRNLGSENAHIQPLEEFVYVEGTHWRDYFMIMPYSNRGDLQMWMGALQMEDLWRSIAWQLVHGVSFMLCRGLSHCDISLENALVQEHRDGRLQVFIHDFGRAVDCPRWPGADGLRFPIPCVKPLYMAPEQLFAHAHPIDGAQLDIYCLGMTLYLLIVQNKPPSPHMPENERLPRMREAMERRGASKLCQNFILSLVRQVPAMRSSVLGERGRRAMIEHPWFEGLRDPVAIRQELEQVDDETQRRQDRWVDQEEA